MHSCTGGRVEFPRVIRSRTPFARPSGCTTYAVFFRQNTSHNPLPNTESREMAVIIEGKISLSLLRSVEKSCFGKWPSFAEWNAPFVRVPSDNFLAERLTCASVAEWGKRSTLAGTLTGRHPSVTDQSASCCQDLCSGRLTRSTKKRGLSATDVCLCVVAFTAHRSIAAAHQWIPSWPGRGMRQHHRRVLRANTQDQQTKANRWLVLNYGRKA